MYGTGLPTHCLLVSFLPVEVRYDIKQYNTSIHYFYHIIQYNTIEVQYSSTMQYNTIQYNMMQFNTIQFNTIQNIIMQCNTLIGLKKPRKKNTERLFYFRDSGKSGLPEAGAYAHST